MVRFLSVGPGVSTLRLKRQRVFPETQVRFTSNAFTFYLKRTCGLRMNVLVFFPGEKKALLKGSGLWLKFSIFASDIIYNVNLLFYL